MHGGLYTSYAESLKPRKITYTYDKKKENHKSAYIIHMCIVWLQKMCSLPPA